VIEVSAALRCLGGILQTKMDLPRTKKEYEIAILKQEQFKDFNADQEKEFLSYRQNCMVMLYLNEKNPD
jgi:hypothetical protein